MVKSAISRQAVATWLSWPSVLGEFHAEPLAGVGIGPEPFQAPPCQPAAQAPDLAAIFRSSVGDLVSPYSSVALSISGGLDSAAVLAHLHEICADKGIQLHLITAELTGDDGATNIHHIDRLLKGVGVDQPVHRIEAHPEDNGKQYFWSPRGPRLDSSAAVNDAMVDTAIGLGAQAVFTGAGSDELTGVVRYMLGSFLAQRRVDLFRAYWSDTISVSKQAGLMESFAVLARALPRRWRAIAFYAVTEDPPIDLTAPRIVGVPFRSHVEEWSRAWMNRRLRFQAESHKSWSAMEAWESLDPVCPPIISDDPIPFLHPFMNREFVTAVMQTRLSDRYGIHHPNAYWRQKSIVLDLIGKQHWDYLPREKQIFSNWMREDEVKNRQTAPHLVELGVVDAAALAGTDDTMLLHRVAELEAWTAVAVGRGYDFVD
ncbi:asparagine synthase-related protein [Kribbella sp. NPDC051620]|uniref:asparagine synthase-related protein n=1 Tax=Kribbella sp. NPDC051620 TaxID=3364120 RepID=UPI00379B6D86